MTRIAAALTALGLAGCAFGPLMYSRAITASKLGPADVERLDTETRSGKGLFGPPFSAVYLRTRASVPETVRLYLKGLREDGWKDLDRNSGWSECWYCALECRQGKECHIPFESEKHGGSLGVHVLAKLEPFKSWPEQLRSRYVGVADEYTWVIVFYSPY